MLSLWAVKEGRLSTLSANIDADYSAISNLISLTTSGAWGSANGPRFGLWHYTYIDFFTFLDLSPVPRFLSAKYQPALSMYHFFSHTHICMKTFASIGR